MNAYPTTSLNDRELLFVAYLLDQGADAIFKRICEDMHPDVFDLFTEAEQDAMQYAYEQINSQGRDYTPGYWPPQGSVQSLSMADRIRTYLAVKYGLPAPTYDTDTDALGRAIKAAIIARERSCP